MAFWQAVVLGIMQGLAEFLPISSSAHLAMGQYFFGIQEPYLFFDVMLHVGTMAAIVLAFRRDIPDVMIAIMGREPGPHSFQRMTKKSGRIFALLIILGSIPTVIIAIAFRIMVERLFLIPPFISAMLLVDGFILWLSGKLRFTSADLHSIGTTDALIIGMAQGIAVIPGISRSGITISTALMRKISAYEAARFSLLLSVPAILGATLLELKDVTEIDVPIMTIMIASLVAFITGYTSIRLLLKSVETGRFAKFAYYCWGVGLLSLVGYLVNM